MRNLSGNSFMRALIPFMRAPPSWPSHLVKVPFPNITALRIRFQRVNFAGTRWVHRKDFPMKPATKGYTGLARGIQLWVVRYQNLYLPDFCFLRIKLSEDEGICSPTLGCILTTPCSSLLTPRLLLFPVLYSQEVSVKTVGRSDSIQSSCIANIEDLTLHLEFGVHYTCYSQL